MNAINGVSTSYVNLVQKKVTQNTVSQVVDAKQAGEAVNKEQIQVSNQVIKDNAREIGGDLYGMSIKKQTAETYIKASQNAADNYSNQSNSSTQSNNTPEIYTFDPQAVNDARKTVQKRAIGIEVYQRINDAPERPAENNRFSINV